MRAGVGMAKETAAKQIVLYGAAIISALTILLGLYFFLHAPYKNTVAFYGVKDETSIKTQIAYTGSVSEMHSAENAPYYFEYPADIHGNYIVTSSIETNGTYRDIQFGIDRAGKKIIINARGFAPQESFSIDGKNISAIDELHFDWAGRIEVIQPMPDKKRYGNICLKSSSGITACHDYDARGGKA